MLKQILSLLFMTTVLFSETLFEVKDASNNKVLDVSTDGLRILNQGDTVMVISSNAVRVNLDNSQDKALSRTFSVSTTSSKGKGLNNVLEVGTGSTIMREGTDGDEYTNFSPENIFLGLNAGTSTTIGNPDSYSGTNNVFLGNYAGTANTSGYFNTFTGYMSGAENQGGHHNSFYGYQSGMNNLSGNYNCAFGHEAGYYLSTGSSNIFMGYRAGHTTSNGTNNIFMGSDAGYFNSSGDYNVGLGYQSCYNLTDGNSNVGIGYMSGYNTTDGDNNIFIGYQAGQANTTGNDNQFMGYMSGQKNTTGSNSLFLGWKSGQNNNIGYENLFVGYNSGSANTSGYGNVCLGTYAGQAFTGGNENVMIGRGAGCYASTTASNNVFLGSYSGYGNAANSGNVFIGNKVGYSSVGSSKLMIDNDDVNATTALIYGDFASDALTVNGTLTSSGNMYMNGTSLQILTNPGTGTSPTNYVYQGSGIGSTSKQYAFAVNDALWVTSHTYIDGNLQIQGGTSIGMTQAGTYTAGVNSSGGVKTFTITFPTAFGATPKINVTPRGENFTDVFAVTTRNISTTSFQVNVYRVDSAGGIWGQNLKLDWFAWE